MLKSKNCKITIFLPTRPNKNIKIKIPINLTVKCIANSKKDCPLKSTKENDLNILFSDNNAIFAKVYQECSSASIETCNYSFFMIKN